VTTELTACPECGWPAEVVYRAQVDASPAPVIQVATACFADRSHNYVQIEDA
jgi:hypothetical protein